MNKVVCNLCGTSYPENAAQCPICGYARSADASSSASSGNGTYTYVKGGRFSKANVKKRNQAAGTMRETPVDTADKKRKSGKKAGIGLTIVMIVLLLAIVAVLGYIAIRFFLPGNKNTDELASSGVVQEDTVNEDTVDTQPEQTQPDLSCTAVLIDQTQIEFAAVGAEVKLSVQLEPADTVDELSYTSSDTSVVTVSKDGTVKAVAEGSAVITVTCGSASAECKVTCTVPTTEPAAAKIALNRKEITFNVEGQSWLVYNGEVSAEEIVWTSDDNKVATITNGKVVAVGNGDTTVYGIYQGQTVSCIIHCSFDEESGESGGISEAGGDSNRTYKLYNPTGYSDDVTLNVGDTFTLKLVDEYKNVITDAEWSVEDSEVCSYEDNTVKALKSGKTRVYATYEGVKYSCLVRVN